MASNVIYSSSPNFILHGIKDESTRVISPESETLPQHLPLFFTFAKWGDENVLDLVSGGQFGKNFGLDTLDYTSKYCTHVTPFLNGLVEQGSSMMVQRLRPSDARTAWVRFSIGVTTFENPTSKDPRKYELRWIKGTPNYLAELAEVADEKVSTVLRRAAEFGQGLSVTTINSDDTGLLGAGLNGNEKVYPIFDVQVTYFGEYGNNYGLRISAPNSASKTRPDTNLFETTLSRPYRFELMQRANARSSAYNYATLGGETTVDVTFKPNDIDPRLGGVDQYIGSKFLDAYQNLDVSPGVHPTHGPFGEIKVYDENIQYIVDMLYRAEQEVDVTIAAEEKERVASKRAELLAKLEAIYASGTTAEKKAVEKELAALDVVDESKRARLIEKSEGMTDEDAMWQIDLVSGRTMDDRAYRSYSIAETRSGTASTSSTGNATATLNENITHWADGGSDGTMSNDVYNELVLAKLRDEFTSDLKQWNNLARYPYTVFYDTGFPEDVKEMIPQLLAARKDVSICMSTHMVEEGARSNAGVVPVNAEMEAARIRGLAVKIRAYPESELYGTKCCRANLISQCGKIIGSTYPGYVPLTYELMMKRADFMGSATGNMISGLGYDQDGVKQLRYMKLLNNTFVPVVKREKNWALGATWAEYYDRYNLFFPAVRTIYKDDTSVLLSDINMLIATDLQKVCFRTWRRLVGDAKMSNEQFASTSDELITRAVEGRYDGRVVIKPETHYTAADELRGYSWHCNIHMYANNMKTVGAFTVVTHRQEDLEG